MQDLSSLAKDGPWVGSEAATNTITETQVFSGEGTPSESTSRTPEGSTGENYSDTMELNYPPGRIKPGKWGPSAVAWKTTNGGQDG